MYYVINPSLDIEAFFYGRVFYGRVFCGGGFKRWLLASAAANFVTLLLGVIVPIIPASARFPTLLHDIFIRGTLSISSRIIDGL